jgi:hypothetical protein
MMLAVATSSFAEPDLMKHRTFRAGTSSFPLALVDQQPLFGIGAPKRPVVGKFL